MVGNTSERSLEVSDPCACSSSFDGALMEIGPFRLQAGENPGDRPTLREIDGAWNEYSNVLFCRSLPCSADLPTYRASDSGSTSWDWLQLYQYR